MTLALKDSVNVASLQPQMMLGITIAWAVYTKMGYELVVTSANDSRHAVTSLHYAGAAVDLRTRDIPRGERSKVADALRRALTADYDVVLESDHIHVEYQPRRR